MTFARTSRRVEPAGLPSGGPFAASPFEPPFDAARPLSPTSCVSEREAVEEDTSFIAYHQAANHYSWLMTQASGPSTLPSPPASEVGDDAASDADSDMDELETARDEWHATYAAYLRIRERNQHAAELRRLGDTVSAELADEVRRLRDENARLAQENTRLCAEIRTLGASITRLQGTAERAYPYQPPPQPSFFGPPSQTTYFGPPSQHSYLGPPSQATCTKFASPAVWSSPMPLWEQVAAWDRQQASKG